MKPTTAIVIASFVAATPLAAQSPLKAAASTRATVEVTLSAPRAQGAPAAPAQKIRIDYGQPHARGRAVAGAIADDLGKIWRLGANSSTTLTTDVDLVIGGATVPKGSYSLYAETAATGPWKLIINHNTGQWGTEYAADKDLVRVPLTVKTLPVSIESLSISLVPAPSGTGGDLRIIWGTREFTTTWALK